MTENSGVFKAAFENNDWLACDNSYIDMESSDAGPVEIVLRAFHEVYTDEMLYVTRTKAKQVLNTLTAFNAPKFKLRYWFFHWLASKDMRQSNGDDGPSVLALCEQFNHAIGAHIVQMKLTSQHLQKSIANYPPFMTPSFRQLSEIIFLKRDVKPSEYVSGGFSKIFQYAYGKPMEYIYPQTKDNNKDKAWQKLCDTTFVEFAYCVDDKVTKWNLSTVWREDMEGAWVQKAVSLYEDEILRLGDTFTSNPYVREGLHCQLKMVIGRRFHPMLRVEKYWAKEGDGMDGKLWMKRVAAQEAVDEMEFAKPGLGEEGIDMGGLLKMMGDLQVQAENDTADPQELTAEEAMIKAQAYFNI